MLTKPTIVFIGAICGLIFLLVSIHNGRSLNNELMEKLVETEEDFKTAADNHESCGRSLTARTQELEAVSSMRDQLQSELQNLREENTNVKTSRRQTEISLDTVSGERNQLLTEKEELVYENEKLQQVIAEKNELLDQLEMTNSNLQSDAEDAKNQLRSQLKRLEDIKNSVIIGAEEQKLVDEAVDKIYDDQGELMVDIEVPEADIENEGEGDEDDAELNDALEEIYNDGEEDKGDIDTTTEDVDENEDGSIDDYEQKQGEAPKDYDSNQSSSISSSFENYEDRKLNQQSLR